jgi:quercetin dioxygenase-like cupin family protein
MKTGAEIPEHSHPYEQMGTVLKGIIDLTIGDDQKRVNEGNAYHIAPEYVNGNETPIVIN